MADIEQTEETETVCVVCGGGVATCGPLVSTDDETTWVGLRHLPKYGQGAFSRRENRG